MLIFSAATIFGQSLIAAYITSVKNNSKGMVTKGWRRLMTIRRALDSFTGFERTKMQKRFRLTSKDIPNTWSKQIGRNSNALSGSLKLLQ